MTLPRQARVAVAGYYPPPFGGESVHVLELAARLRARGLLRQVVNLRRGAPPSPEYVGGAGAVRLFARLASLLDRETLLHLHSNGHSWRSWRVIAAAAAELRRSRTPAVLTLHSGMSPAFLARRTRLGRAIVRRALGAFGAVVCVNDAIRTEVMRLGIAARRIEVIPAFLARAGGPLSPEDERIVAPMQPFLCAVAGDGPEYGVDGLIRALGRLAPEHPSFGCVVIGTAGSGRPAALAAELGLGEDRVRFLGPSTHDRCLSLVERADVFVRPTLADGDATSVREALALGVPVVASATASRPAGVVTFPIGDDEALARTIADAIRSGRGGAAPEAREDSFAALLAVYARAIEEAA